MQLGPVELEAYFKYKNVTYTKDLATGEVKVNSYSLHAAE